MSYTVELYRPEFLRRAIAEQLGDWTDADPIPEADRDQIAAHLKGAGYIQENSHPQFGQSFGHPDERLGIQASIHAGSISFNVPYWEDATEGIMIVKELAQELAERFDLMLYDPQTGETDP